MTVELDPVACWHAWGRAIAASAGLTSLDLTALVPSIRVKAQVTRVTIELCGTSAGFVEFIVVVRLLKKSPIEIQQDQETTTTLNAATWRKVISRDGVGRVVPAVLESSSFMGAACRYLEVGQLNRLAYGVDRELGELREIDGDFTSPRDPYELFTELGLTCVDESQGQPVTREDWRDAWERNITDSSTKLVWTDPEGGRIEPTKFGLMNVRWGYRGPRFRSF
jgi:hypothetical protein